MFLTKRLELTKFKSFLYFIQKYEINIKKIKYKAKQL